MNTRRFYFLAGLVFVVALLVGGLGSQENVRAEEGSPSGVLTQQVYLPIVSMNAGIHPEEQGLATVDDQGKLITRVLARGSPIHGANGMYFGPDGYLYIASFSEGKIIVMDADSGRIIKRIVPEMGMDSPDDLTFGPDGSLYWTSLASGRVGKMTPDGTQSLLVQLPPGPNPITFSDDGRLFVGLCFLGEGLYEIDPEGIDPPHLIITNTGTLNAFDFGPDGYLYGPIYNEDKVVKIDVDSGEMWDFADDFGGTAAVKFDSLGRMYVAGPGAGTVTRMDLDSGERQVVAHLTPGLDNLAFDGRGRLFVSNAEEGSIVEALPNGKGRPVSPGGMISPGGIALLTDGNGRESLFVTDLFTLRQFNAQTGQQLSVERGLMWSLHTASPDGANVLVTSWMDNAVHVYDPATRTLLDTRLDFLGPMNAIRFQGDLVVSELGTSSVVRSSGPGDRQVLATLGLPVGLAATEDDLWVADWAIGAVFQLIQDGNPVLIPVTFGLVNPEGLAVAPDGNLLVVESGAGRVSKIDLATGTVTPYVEGLKLGMPAMDSMPPFWIYNGIAVSPSGAIFVSGDIANVIYRIDERP